MAKLYRKLIAFYMSHHSFRILFGLNLVFIVVASLIPSSMPPIWHLDKVGHFAAYSSLFTLALFSFQPSWIRIATFFLAATLGVAMEWLQSYVPGREVSAIDAITNVAGLVFGIFVYRTIKSHFPALGGSP